MRSIFVDVAHSSDGKPLLLRIEAGAIADMVLNTKAQAKKVLGTLAYPLQAIPQLPNATQSTYMMTIDGVVIQEQGVSLVIANVGNVGIPGISIRPDVSCTDGMLDIFVLQSADIGTLLSIGTSTVTGAASPKSLKQWKCKHITVQIDPPQTVIHDDQAVETAMIDVTLGSQKLHVLV